MDSAKAHLLWWEKLPAAEKSSAWAKTLIKTHMPNEGELPNMSPQQFAKEVLAHGILTPGSWIRLDTHLNTVKEIREESPVEGQTAKYAHWWIRTFWVYYRRYIAVLEDIKDIPEAELFD